MYVLVFVPGGGVCRSIDSNTKSLSTDVLLQLLDNSGNWLVSDYGDGASGSGPGENDRLTYLAPTSGTYYLDAQASGTGTGTYTVSAAAISTTLTDDYLASTATTGVVPMDGSTTGDIETTNWVSKASTGEAVVVTLSRMPGKILDPGKMIATTRDSLLKSLNATLDNEQKSADAASDALLFHSAAAFFRASSASPARHHERPQESSRSQRSGSRPSSPSTRWACILWVTASSWASAAEAKPAAARV